MKIKGSDFSELEAAVLSSSVYPELLNYRERGLSDKRYRWDCLWAVHSSMKVWFDRVYTYANDDHIDSALRKITGTK